MATVIDLSQEPEDHHSPVSSDDDIEILELNNATQTILSQQPPAKPENKTKALSELQCPICFDDVTNATVTSCGHVFCLTCIQQSISSSTARGQTRRSGVGLCPLCRKSVNFKDTTLMRMKIATVTSKVPPQLPEEKRDGEETIP